MWSDDVGMSADEEWRLSDALIHLMATRDNATKEHCERVATLSRAIARSMCLSPQQIADIDLAARLHDIGKLLITQSILTKEGRLTEYEYDQIKAHPIHSRSMLSMHPALAHIAIIVGQHHERIDGRGYPDGLSTDQITLEARVIACADALDAMTAGRPYRDTLSFDAALEELQRHAGSQFDPWVVRVACNVFALAA